MSNKLRVLVVDDSALMRKLIPQILAQDSEIEVVGTAMDGAFGLKKIEDLRPDVVTLDLEMPRMDGLETLRQITRRFRVPVIVVSALTTEGASATFKALALGAFDFVAKPRDAASAHMDEIALDLINKIKVAAKSKLRNEVLTLLHLHRLERDQSETGKMFVVVITTGERKFGLVVDHLVGEEELVIKAMDDHLVATDLVSGASILGDGTVVLILNLSSVVAKLGKLQMVGATA